MYVDIIVANKNIDFETFIDSLPKQLKPFENKNIIVDISVFKNLKIQQINLFLPTIKKYKLSKKSFVIVASQINFNKISDKIIIAPTIVEANDIIDMDEVERDLGFKLK